MRLVFLVLCIRLISSKDYLIEYSSENEFKNELFARNISHSNLSSILINDEFENVINIFSLTTKANVSDFKLHDNKMHTNNNFLPNESNATTFENTYDKYLSTKYLYWNKGYTGKAVRIGIFDSGVNSKNLNCNIVDKINYTDETDEDNEGHGTFITSVNWINLDYM